jgi:hypothetical protein
MKYQLKQINLKEQVKGRNFTFEGFEYRPSSMMTNLAFEAYLKKYKK